MNEKMSLLWIWWLSLAGTLFSGYLSWNEMSGTCLLGGCKTLGNIPACVYGCIMFMAILVVSSLGLSAIPAPAARTRRKRRR